VFARADIPRIVPRIVVGVGVDPVFVVVDIAS